MQTTSGTRQSDNSTQPKKLDWFVILLYTIGIAGFALVAAIIISLLNSTFQAGG